MTDLRDAAERFRALHHGPHPLVLPNAWDVPSARLFEEAGFPALATSSAALMVARGYPDGQEMPRRELIGEIRRIAQAVDLPVSADLVAGYGRGANAVAQTVRAVVGAGAVGLNLEDQDPVDHHLLPLRGQLRKISAIRAAGEAVGVPVVINARTDALRRGPGTPDEQFQEAVRRCLAFRDAGADCVYPMGLFEADAIERFVRAVQCPVNVMVRPGLPPVAELERLGVRRVSFGPAAAYAAYGLLRRIGEEVRSRGTFGRLVDGALTHDELNQLARRRPSPVPAASPAAGG